MSLADIVRKGVAQIHKITNDGELQETIELERWIGQDDTGAPTYASVLAIEAIVERKARRIRLASGAETITTAIVTILQPIKKIAVVEGRREPIDPRDKITLADGATGPILTPDAGLRDPDTNRPYLVQVYMG